MDGPPSNAPRALPWWTWLLALLALLGLVFLLADLVVPDPTVEPDPVEAPAP